jgi:polyribonucleotide nucleotidyltransferase
MATVVGAKKVNPEVDYFPLSVNYQEKYYAAGKIPGGYFKREARPTESETLISRLIDRPIRPLFPDEFKNEVQLLPTVISYDKENEADILSIIASSAALSISGMPFMGPVGASRVGFIDGKYVLNPSKKELEKSKLDLVVAGTKDAVLMVESEAKGLTEEEMLNAVKFGHENFIPIIKMIEELAKECKKTDWVVEKKDLSEVKKKLSDEFTDDLKKAFSTRDKQERSNMISEITDKAKKLYEQNETITDLDVNSELKNLEKSIVRTDILKNKNRIDGRGLSDVRPIMCEVGILPRVHGSALFTRGETQAIVTTTLGTSDDEQRIESLEGLQRERFMLHYNFPPFSVGETGRIGTGRREIGHGKLAWRAINSSLPSKESFPYTFRIVSEITESNGSSSMATVCGTSLALMDAGVPIKEPVAGIAMGLIKEGNEFSVLSDILGDEDHLGDMDFKVAGTKDGITSLQMDIKITGITFEIMEQALKQAKDGRVHILGEMNKALGKSRDEVGKHTPKMEKITVDKKDIATVIGKGGATIREIVEKSGAKVDVNDEGVVTVAAPDDESRNKAMQFIKDLTAKAEMNKIYNGKVIKIMEFGAFVNFLGKQDGLVHISELANKRVAKVTDVLKEGDAVKVKVIGFDRGKVKLSIKQAAV